jgi:hypothetical protein
MRNTRRYAKHDIPRPFRAAAHHSRGARRRVTTRVAEERDVMKFLDYEVLLGQGLQHMLRVSNAPNTT